MFERFGVEGREVVVFAQQEARDLRHSYIGTEHVLLGVTREREGVAGRVLGEFGVTEDRVREDVVRIVGRGDVVSRGAIPFTPRTIAAFAAAEAQRLAVGHEAIEAEHILLGLMQGEGGTARRILADAGLEHLTVRAAIVRALQDTPLRRPAARPVAVDHQAPSGDWEARPRVEAISAQQAAGFGLLRRPQHDCDRLPRAHQKAIQRGRIGLRGLNPALARRVTTLAGDVWVIPGNGYIGLVVPGGITCNPTEHATTCGIITWGSTAAIDQDMVHGLLPDGVEQITLITGDGTSTTVKVNENVYGAILDGHFRAAHFDSPTGTVELGPWR